MMGKKIFSIIAIFVILLSYFLVLGVVAETPIFETFERVTSYSQGWYQTTLNGAITQNSSQAYTGTYSTYVNVYGTSGAGKKAFWAKQITSTNNSQMYGQCRFYWEYGNPPTDDADGLKIIGFNDAMNGATVNALLTKKGSTYNFTVRGYFSGTWTAYYSTKTASTGQWYHVELYVNSTGFRLWVDDVLYLDQLVTYKNINWFIVGNDYSCVTTGIRYFIDDAWATTGSRDIGNGPSTYYSSQTTLNPRTSTQLNYPTVADGYLWICESNSTSGGVLRKWTLDTNVELANTTIEDVGELFAPFVIDDYIICYGNDASGSPNGTIIIFNKADLSQVVRHEWANSATNFLVNCIYDEANDRLIFSTDQVSSTYAQILFVDRADILTKASYEFEEIVDCSVTSIETQTVIFNSEYYVIITNPCAGATSTVTTRMYKSSDLETWTHEWNVSYTNTGGGAYFAHLSASDSYIVAGYVDDATSNHKTQRLYYKSVAGSWTSFDMGFMEIGGEDHPNVDAISDNLFLIQTCIRFNDVSPAYFVFDASTGTLTYLFSLTGSNTGYSDRYAGIDVDSDVLYVANCEDTATTAKIVKISMSVPLEVPGYYEYWEEPAPTPTPTPTASPTPTPVRTVSPEDVEPYTQEGTFYILILVIFACIAVGVGLYNTVDSSGNRGVGILLAFIGLILFIILLVAFGIL